MIVHHFSNKKLKILYPDFNFKSHFIRIKSDLKLKTLFLICGTLLHCLLFHLWLLGNAANNAWATNCVCEKQ